MKKQIIVLFFAFATAAFGSSDCPMLAGKYPTCTIVESVDPETSVPMSDIYILQKGSYFTIDSLIGGEPGSESVIADGVERSESETNPETGEVEITKTTASCNANSLSILVKMPLMGSVIEGTMLYSVKNNELTIRTLIFEEELQVTVCK